MFTDIAQAAQNLHDMATAAGADLDDLKDLSHRLNRYVGHYKNGTLELPQALYLMTLSTTATMRGRLHEMPAPAE